MVNPLSIDVRKDNNCSLEHVVSEAGTRVPSSFPFPALVAPSKPRVTVISVTLPPFSDESLDTAVDFCPPFVILTSVKNFTNRSQ